MTDDMSQFLGVFLDEAAEQLEILESSILILEQEASPELLSAIFRAAHTLKGSSRAMGFTAMGELTHAMEDVFDRLRHDTLPVTRPLIDALLAGLDALQTMRDEIADSGATTLNTDAQTAALRHVLSAECRVPSAEENSATLVSSIQKSAQSDEASTLSTHHSALSTSLTETEQEAVAAARDSGFAVYELRVRLAADCVMKSVRATMVLRALDALGAVLATTPDEEGLDNEAFENEFALVFATEQPVETVQSAACRIAEISEVHAAPWPDEPNPTGTAGGGTASVSAAPGSHPQPDATAGPVGKEGPEVRGQGPGANDTSDTQRSALIIDNSQEERRADAGPEGRGKPAGDVQKLAAERADKAAHDKTAGGDKKTAQAQTVRVDVARLDKLLDLVGELVIDRTRLARIGGLIAASRDNGDDVNSLRETAAHIGRITDELQNEIMKARMLPVDSVFSRFPRMMRDLAQKLGKEIAFVMEGGQTELDRSVLEILGDPLIHMLRNSVDHGLELPAEREADGKERTGNVWLRARHEENNILIEIEDDGRGLNPEKLKASAINKGILTPDAARTMSDAEAFQLIFAAGFSTAAVLTDVSGRGVGMDIVRSNLQRVGARIDIESRVGVGTTFRIRLPLTLAIVGGLLVTVGTGVYALPLASIIEALPLDGQERHVIGGREVCWLRDRTVPLIRLRDRFGDGGATTPAEQTLARELARQTADNDSKNSNEPDQDAAESHLESENTPISSAERTRFQPRRGDAAEYVVIVGAGERQAGLVVDTLLGEQEVVIKPLGRFLGDVSGISGATILGDGRVALILDVVSLLQSAEPTGNKREPALAG